MSLIKNQVSSQEQQVQIIKDFYSLPPITSLAQEGWAMVLYFVIGIYFFYKLRTAKTDFPFFYKFFTTKAAIVFLSVIVVFVCFLKPLVVLLQMKPHSISVKENEVVLVSVLKNYSLKPEDIVVFETLPVDNNKDNVYDICNVTIKTKADEYNLKMHYAEEYDFFNNHCKNPVNILFKDIPEEKKSADEIFIDRIKKFLNKI